jgi:hypothetical protein
MEGIRLSLNAIKEALLTVGPPVSHYTAFEQPDEYIVWAEDNQADSVWADGHMQEQTIEGTIDYFTKTENDSNVQKIQNALNDGNISWRLNSVQYETETHYIHFEWVFQVGAW